MPRLTAVQVAQVCAQAGFKGSALTWAVAVALAESGGNTQAVGTNHDSHRSRDRGLFQINSYWHKEVTDAQAFDPAQNAAAAYRISKAGTDWSQWSTWPALAGAQVPAARIAVAQAGPGSSGVQQVADGGGSGGGGSWSDDGDVEQGVPDSGDLSDLVPSIPNPIDGIESMADGVKAIASGVIKVGAWVADPHNWVRIELAILGGVGLLVALTMISKSGAAGDTVAGSVKKVGDSASGAVKTAATVAMVA